MHQPHRSEPVNRALQSILRALAVAAAALAGSMPTAHASTALGSAQQPAPLCPPAEGRQLLRLTTTDPKQQAVCSITGLQALTQRTIATSLPPSLGAAGLHQWQGVSLRLLAESLGVTPGVTTQLTALNDYVVTVPWSDLVRYDPIVAYRRNGEALSVRENGPFILIYPFDHHPELHSQPYLNRSIWQLQAIAFK